jgi:hypothetical protein
MVSKDTLYYFEDHGRRYLGFYFGVDEEGDYHGWANYLDSFYTETAWSWSQIEEVRGFNPIGQRCILQW